MDKNTNKKNEPLRPQHHNEFYVIHTKTQLNERMKQQKPILTLKTVVFGPKTCLSPIVVENNEFIVDKIHSRCILITYLTHHASSN